MNNKEDKQVLYTIKAKKPVFCIPKYGGILNNILNNITNRVLSRVWSKVHNSIYNVSPYNGIQKWGIFQKVVYKIKKAEGIG